LGNRQRSLSNFEFAEVLAESLGYTNIRVEALLLCPEYEHGFWGISVNQIPH
jgi:hypothetical protein